MTMAKKRTAKLEVFQEATETAFRYRLRGKNGEIMLASEGYPTRGNALRAARRVVQAAMDAELVDLTR